MSEQKIFGRLLQRARSKFASLRKNGRNPGKIKSPTTKREFRKRNDHHSDAENGPISSNRNSQPPGDQVPANNIPLSEIGDTSSDVPEQSVVEAANSVPSAIESPETQKYESSSRQTLWHTAFEEFKSTDEASYNELRRIGSNDEDLIAGIRKFIEDKNRKRRGIHPETEKAFRNIVDCKDLLIAIANFDPTKATVLVFRGIFHLLQVSRIFFN